MAKLIGTAPNQVPTNADLGSMAFEDRNNYITKGASVHQPYRNLIINGDMSIAQRGTSSDGSSAYLIDRFKKQIDTTGNGAVSQSTDAPSGFEYSQAIVMSGSSSFIQTAQQIELKNIRHALGQQVTLSFYYKSSIDIILRVRTRTDTEDATALFSASTAHTETFSSTGTWTRATKTFTLASNIKAISVDFGTGAVVSGDNFYLTGVQLEVGTSASDFEFLPYDVNLRRCERYFQSYISSTGQAFIWSGDTTNGQGYFFTAVTPEMRTIPTLTVDGSVSVNGFNAATFATNHSTENTIRINCDCNSTGARRYYQWNCTLDAEL